MNYQPIEPILSLDGFFDDLETLCVATLKRGLDSYGNCRASAARSTSLWIWPGHMSRRGQLFTQKFVRPMKYFEVKVRRVFNGYYIVRVASEVGCPYVSRQYRTTLCWLFQMYNSLMPFIDVVFYELNLGYLEELVYCNKALHVIP